jgi:glutathione S-transferase
MCKFLHTAGLQRNTPQFGFPLLSRLLYSPAEVYFREVTMQLYDSLGPNPRAMRMFLAEKGISIPIKTVDLMGAENRKPPYTDRNPGGQLPALELDNGKCIGETVAIWEYLEEKHPTPALIGTTAEERAEARQWQRRIELQITEHLYNGFRYSEGAALFKDRMRILPEAAPGLKAIVQDKLKWLDQLLEGKQYIAGDRFTIADIILYCALDFGGSVKQPIDPSLKNVNAWFKRVDSRPSAKSSLHPASAQTGLKG